MRRLAALGLILVAFAAHAADAPPAHPITVVKPAVKVAPPPRRAPPTITSPAPAPLTAWTQGGLDSAACQQTCAQSRYFCEAGPSPDDCPPAWSQCVAACASPALDTASAAGQ
jgi:hypothetical protein